MMIDVENGFGYPRAKELVAIWTVEMSHEADELGLPVINVVVVLFLL